MGLIMRSVPGARFYCDPETRDMYEENAEGVFALRWIDGERARVPVEAIPGSAQMLYCDMQRAWEFVRP